MALGCRGVSRPQLVKLLKAPEASLDSYPHKHHPLLRDKSGHDVFGFFCLPETSVQLWFPYNHMHHAMVSGAYPNVPLWEGREVYSWRPLWSLNYELYTSVHSFPIHFYLKEICSK